VLANFKYTTLVELMAETADTDVRALESLIAFWKEAGVEACYEDQPVDRTFRPAPPARPAPALAGGAKVPAAPPTPDVAQAVAQAREMAAAAADLEALAAAIAAFEGCPLKFQGARQAVFSRGAADAPVMVIGEGPGAEEDSQGAPFVGRAGKLLDRMLEAAGLQNRVFITNTVFWRPPGNRTPSPAEQMTCQPFLERAVELISPRLLLLVGGASAKSMLSKEEGILSLRGRWFEWRSQDGTLVLPALPTLHPAFLLRQPAAKKKAWADLLTLTERLDRQSRPA
jgi:DNA polymerase